MSASADDLWPLPIARACRNFRACGEAKEAHDRAFSVFEVLLKYIAALFISQYVRGGERDHRVNAALKGLARPSLGEWAGFLRELLRFFSEHPQAAPAPILELAAQLKAREASPALLDLHGALIELLEKRPGKLSRITLLQFFDLLIRYRNWGLGHGAPMPRQTYEMLAEKFSAALEAALDALGGLTRMELVVAGTRNGSGPVLYNAMGPGNPLERPPIPDAAGHAGDLAAAPPGDRLLIRAGGRLHDCHPLVVHLENDVYFLNSGLDAKRLRVEYLSYSTGDHQAPADLEAEQRRLLGIILGYDLTEQEFTRILTSLDAGAPRAAAESGPGPRVLGEYTIIRELGRGGMGVVYEAHQQSLGRRVALKVLAAGAEDRLRARFERECRATARLHHPNIIPVLDVGEADGMPYFSMALIEGPNLSEIIRDQRAAGGTGAPGTAPGAPRPKWQAVVWVERLRDVARAIHYAHELGMVHRDIKPANLMLDPGGRLVVLDFGLVQDESQAALTASSDRLGTLRYMSPEQVLRRKVDRRSDVWSLGATLYETLALEPPFAGEVELELEQAIAGGEFPALRRKNRRLGSDLETIVHKALEKNPERRYQTAGELADDLDRFLAYRPIRARPPSLARRIWKAAYRHRLITLPAAAALLILAVLGLVWMAQTEKKFRSLEAGVREAVDREDAESAGALLAQMEKDFPGAGRQGPIQDTRILVDSLKTHLRIAAARSAHAEGKASRDGYLALGNRVQVLEEDWIAKRKAHDRTSWDPPWDRSEELEAWSAFEGALKGREAIYQQAENRLEQALGTLPAMAQTADLSLSIRGDLLELFMNKYNRQRARSEKPIGEEYFLDKARRLDLQGSPYDRLLRGYGKVSILSDPPGAEVFCFRYTSLHEARLIPLPFHPQRGEVGKPFLEVERVWIEGSAFKAGDRWLRIRSGETWRDLSLPTDLALALNEGARFDAEAEVQVLREGKEISIPWVPFPRAKVEKFNAVAREPLKTPRAIHFKDQFGLTFAACPLELTDGNRLGAAAAGKPVEVDLQAGSYLFLLRAPGRADARLPILIPRQENQAETVRLLEPGDAPPGFTYVPEGRFTYGGDQKETLSLPFGDERLQGFFISRHEVTAGEFGNFVNDAEILAKTTADGWTEPWTDQGKRLVKSSFDADPEKKRYRLIPWDSNRGLHWKKSGAGTWEKPEGSADDAPAMGISWLAAQEYGAWRTRKSAGRWNFSLPSDKQWEKAARAADHRTYVWGEYLIFSYSKTNNGGYQDRKRLEPVGSYPVDESAYGVRDLAGSVSEFTQDTTEGAFCSMRGGSWYSVQDYYYRIANRNGRLPLRQAVDQGFRLAAELPAPK